MASSLLNASWFKNQPIKRLKKERKHAYLLGNSDENTRMFHITEYEHLVLWLCAYERGREDK